MIDFTSLDLSSVRCSTKLDCLFFHHSSFFLLFLFLLSIKSFSKEISSSMSFSTSVHISLNFTKIIFK